MTCYYYSHHGRGEMLKIQSLRNWLLCLDHGHGDASGDFESSILSYFALEMAWNGFRELLKGILHLIKKKEWIKYLIMRI